MVIAYEMVKRSFDRGRAAGRADARRQNAAYYKRMQKAKERGEEFNEPPPNFDDAEKQEQD